MYDISGDIHGHAEALERLLAKLGYRQRAGVWAHPQRQVIFVGDYVDRGPEQLKTVEIVRNMVEHEQALAIMGNHEFNAVAYATEHPEPPGQYLRPHTATKTRQHREFLQQVGAGSDQHLELIEWFRTLPLYLELDELRVIHACWHPHELQHLRDHHLDTANRLKPEAWLAVSNKGSADFKALETCLKGLEISLPEGYSFTDKDDVERYEIRTRWWLEGELSYQDVALQDRETRAGLPDHPLPAGVLPGYDASKPVFLGHYWLKGEPKPLTRHIACLDYSIAGDKMLDHERKLCAYRWQGESELTAANYTWVGYRDQGLAG